MLPAYLKNILFVYLLSLLFPAAAGFAENLIENNDAKLLSASACRCDHILSFTVEKSEVNNSLIVQWEADAQIDTAEFYLWRSSTKDGVYTRITGNQLIYGGGGISGNAYSYEDFDIVLGKTYYYKLKIIEEDQSQWFCGPVASDGSIKWGDDDHCDDDHHHDDDDDHIVVNCFISALTN